MHLRRYKSIIWLLLATNGLLLGFQARPAATASATGSGQIQGKVIADTGGAPVAGATVTVMRLQAGPGVASRASTATDGSFILSGLPVGAFGVCVLNAAGIVDPCTWPDVLTRVDVADGKTSPPVTVRAHAVSVIRVRINDAGKDLSKRQSDSAAPLVVVGAFDMTGIFHAGREVKRDGAGIDFEIPIPRDTPAHLTVSSNQVKLETEKHVALGLSGQQEVVVNAGNGPDKQFVFNVTGRK